MKLARNSLVIRVAFLPEAILGGESEEKMQAMFSKLNLCGLVGRILVLPIFFVFFVVVGAVSFIPVVVIYLTTETEWSRRTAERIQAAWSASQLYKWKAALCPRIEVVDADENSFPEGARCATPVNPKP